MDNDIPKLEIIDIDEWTVKKSFVPRRGMLIRDIYTKPSISKSRRNRRVRLPEEVKRWFQYCGRIGYILSRHPRAEIRFPDLQDGMPLNVTEFFQEQGHLGSMIAKANNMHTAYCEVCNNDFVAEAKGARYCSNKCRQFAYRRRRAEQDEREGKL